MDKFVIPRKRPAPALATSTKPSSVLTAPVAASDVVKKRARVAQTDGDHNNDTGDADCPLKPHAAWLFERVPGHWKPILREACSHYTFDHVAQFLRCEIGHHHVFYPPMPDVFEALRRCRVATPNAAPAGDVGGGDGPADIAVVILGQDPYIHEGQAHGMAFSVRAGTPTPPSLANVFREVHTDLLATPKPVVFAPTTGCLVGWARQGVLLLNTCLTVEAGQPGSHVGRGWEPFTDAIITAVSKRSAHPVVFMLWGRDAQGKRKLIDQNRHKILEASHPSPKSAADGFFGCRHFTQANAFLVKHRRPKIDWTDLSLDPVPPQPPSHQQEQYRTNDDDSETTAEPDDKSTDTNTDNNGHVAHDDNVQE
ncbi:Uracil-DNA glycosylase [Pandoravirus neocaledonia]|uniref:Uracil-DNA glycosylase n=1 Tax=Pandoravirus neocaledonia TaxID=2107708 RepID=A0A2U7UDD8_9VIRU|nr:Uracil-DNA glycosylase [Pandoravirus neocaledonia]AVK76453.1 Uracil-DNA glycosylase [Pandoravirus neocaledonia]